MFFFYINLKSRRRYVINIDTNKTEGAFRFIGINVNHIPTSIIFATDQGTDNDLTFIKKKHMSIRYHSLHEKKSSMKSLNVYVFSYVWASYMALP